MPRDNHAHEFDAERRLRSALGREPTAKEIADLRLAEQALGLDQPSFLKARELAARAERLQERSLELTAKLRQSRKTTRSTRKKSRRLRTKAQRTNGLPK